MISDHKCVFTEFLLHVAVEPATCFAELSELTLLGLETPVHSRWRLDPGSAGPRSRDYEQPRAQHPAASRSGTLPFTAALRNRVFMRFCAPPQGSV